MRDSLVKSLKLTVIASFSFLISAWLGEGIVVNVKNFSIFFIASLVLYYLYVRKE